MATGVTDAFYEPLNGILEGPEEFAQGVLRGGKSLTTNVVLGVTGSIGKIAGSVAKGVAHLTLDEVCHPPGTLLCLRIPLSSAMSCCGDRSTLQLASSRQSRNRLSRE